MSKQWTLEEIRAKSRRYSGRLSTNNLSDTELDVYINDFYQNDLPGILGVHEFELWVTFNLVINDGDVNIDVDIPGGVDIHVIEQPFTVAGNLVNFFTDPVRFHELWPEGGEPYTSGDVQDVLLLGRDLYFRPPPDSADEVKFLVKRTSPAALLAGQSPVDQRWGKLIAAGAAKIILEENGEDSTGAVTIIQEQKTIFTREKLQMLQKTATSRREL